MRNQIEIERINRFLGMALPIIVEVVRTILLMLDFRIAEKGYGLDLIFSVSGCKLAKL